MLLKKDDTSGTAAVVAPAAPPVTQEGRYCQAISFLWPWRLACRPLHHWDSVNIRRTIHQHLNEVHCSQVIPHLDMD
jgi:hypothetical protein